MTAISKVFLGLVFSCSVMDAADSGSPARAGAKRRTSNPDVSSVIIAAGGGVCPSTPKRPTRNVQRLSPSGHIHNSAARGVPTPLRDRLPEGLDSAAKRAEALLVLQEAQSCGASVIASVAGALNQMADFEVARPALEAARLAGEVLSPRRVRSASVAGHYDVAKANKSKRDGIPQIRLAIAAKGVPVTPGLEWGHLAKPTIKSNGTVLGGHLEKAYTSPGAPLVIADSVRLLDSHAKVLELRSPDPSKTKVVAKTVWAEEASSQSEVVSILCGSSIIASSGQGGCKNLLNSPHGTLVGFLKGERDHSVYGTVFPVPFLSAAELEKPEMVLGYRDGAPVIISSDAVKATVRNLAEQDLRLNFQDPSNKPQLTVFSDAHGAYAVGGVKIPGFPSHAVVELTDEMKRTLPLPGVPAYDLPAPVGTSIKPL